MSQVRLIPRLDIKGENLVKGINLEGFRALGDANVYAVKYYKDQADEIILNDVVASLYNRNTLHNFVRNLSNEVFVPLIVGGGIKTLNQIEYLLKSGADRVFLNSSIIENPKFLSSAVKYFGSSTIVASLEVIFFKNKYTCLSHSGREITNLELENWAKEIESRGASEILLTSVNEDGMGNGFDLNALTLLDNIVNIPIIISGGYGKPKHINSLKKIKNLSGVTISSALHYSVKDELNIKTDTSSEGNFSFFLKKTSYKNFKNIKIKNLKKMIQKSL